MLATQFRETIEHAPLKALNDLAHKVWQAHGSDLLSDEEAQSLADLIKARKAIAPPNPMGLGRRKSLFPPRRTQRAPDRREAWERKRRLAASGPLPPRLASQFTEGERAVLRIVADEVRQHGCCTLCLDEIAARAGLGRTTAQNAIRRAEHLQLLHRQLREVKGRRNDPNRLVVVSPEWHAWIKRGPVSKAWVQKPAPHGKGSLFLKGLEHRNAREAAFDRLGASPQPSPNRWRPPLRT